MATWTISETASKTGLSAHTLRWYERIGLLDRVRRGGDGRRRFNEDDLGWLGTITKLRETGMPVSDMQRYAELVRSGAGRRERIDLLRRHREHVLEALQAQQACLRLIEYKIDIYEQQLQREVDPACEPSS